MEFKFEKQIIWQKAMDVGEMVNQLTNSFPQKELYNLSSQFRRSADSVALNISEGSTGQINPEFKRFMKIAIRSLMNLMIAFTKISNKNNGIQI